ncbi:glycosyltransferase family A protein [Catalinimonas sp. 4WD22]|uniref:glycosyltransferase family 2 protein n=1 Tax=Catalinimonas locisalis TaxID=3133978 RepID=UPI00310129E4
MQPKISVITPLYNRKTLVEDTIKSILRQSYENWEHIFVDDGSTDGSQNVIQSYSQKDNRIKLFYRDRELKGAPTCRNIGIEKSTGKYIIFLDSDDILASFCLQQRVEVIQKYSLFDFWVFPGLVFKEAPGDTSLLINYFDEEEDDIMRFIDQNTPWLIFNPIWRKTSLVEKNLRWNEDLPAFQDYDFHLNALLKNFTYKKLNVQPDCFWRRHSGESISRGKNALDRILGLEQSCYHLIDNLQKKGSFKQVYQRSLASSYFNISSTLLTLGEREQADRVWQKALDLSLVNQQRYSEGKYYSKLQSLPWVKGNVFLEKVIKKLFYLYWGKQFFNKNYGGFVRTHFSGEIKL